MKCEKCGGSNLYVVNSRPGANGIGSRRRRECADCGERVTTYEVTQKEYDLIQKSQKMLKKVQEMLDIYKKEEPKMNEDEAE